MRVVFPRRVLTLDRAARRSSRGNGLASIVERRRPTPQASYQHDRERIDDAKHHPGANAALSCSLLGARPGARRPRPRLVFYGRERGTGYDREYEQEPPTDTEPALVPPLLRQATDVGSQEFTATLFDLIRRGRYKSSPVTTEKKLWGGLATRTSPTWLRPATRPSAAPTSRSRSPTVIDSVVDADGERLSEFREKIEKHRYFEREALHQLQESVGAAIKARKWFATPAAGCSASALAACVGRRGRPALDRHRRLAPGAPRWSDVVLVALGGCAIANAVVLVLALTPRRGSGGGARRPARPRPSAGTRSAAT